MSYLLKCSLYSFATLCIKVFNLKANEKTVKYHKKSELNCLFLAYTPAILWEEPNNNSETYLHLKAMYLCTTTVITVVVIYMESRFSAFFLPAALLCRVLLINDCNRHQFACGGRRGLQITVTHRQKKKKRMRQWQSR